MATIIGITGGIASGKSTVLSEIRKAGYETIDADQVVHDLQAKGGELYQALLDWLGQEILAEDGQLDRAKLSQLIFSKPENQATSSQLQNAIIRRELAKRRDELAASQAVFFMDIPLLIELDYLDWFDQIWLVSLDKDQQVERLIKRNAYSRQEALQRIETQMPLADKKPYADVLLDNNGSVEALRKQVDQALSDLKREA